MPPVTSPTTRVPKQRKRAAYKTKSGGYIVKERDDGRLECLHPACEFAGEWCEHVAKYVTENADGEISALANPRLLIVNVPLVPTSGLWVEVCLTAPNQYGQRAVWTLVQNERVDLGFWSPGEGRLSLRETILDFIKGNIPKHSTCPSPTHNQWQKLECTEVVLTWSIMTKGVCPKCVEFTDFAADAPEL